MSTSPKTPAKNDAAQEAEPLFVLTRLFNAPRELVWKAWTDEKQMVQWWGPRCFTSNECRMDVRPGGAYRIVMGRPGGEAYPIKGFFRVVEPPHRLVMTQDVSEHPAHWHDMVNPNRAATDTNPAGELLLTVTFEEEAGKTRLTLSTLFKSREIRDAMVKMGMNEGWGESLDRLAELVDVSGDNARQLVATRIFDAPPELVFDAWTDAEHISQWWGPVGFTTITSEMDVRPGGVWRHVMRGPDGTEYPNEIVYVDVVRPKRIVYDHVSPPRFTSTATFVDLCGKTSLTVRLVFASVAEREMVVKEYRAGEGLIQMLGRLGEYLCKAQS